MRFFLEGLGCSFEEGEAEGLAAGALALAEEAFLSFSRSFLPSFFFLELLPSAGDAEGGDDPAACILGEVCSRVELALVFATTYSNDSISHLALHNLDP